MPTENAKPSEELIDVGETVGAEINLDDKGVPEKVEEVKEEKIEVEEVSDVPVQEDKREPVETKKEEKDELKEYSEGVQKRIAKLTRKMREAERQREEAIAFAEANKKRAEEVESKLSKLDKTYVSEFEGRVKTSLAAAKLALKNAIDSPLIKTPLKKHHFNKESAYLGSVFTVPNQRGAFILPSVLGFIIKYLTENSKINRLILLVHPKTTGASKFYQALGFKKINN